ncbi:hypothetical protein D3C86_1283610 [compost metagenome]
MLVRHESHRGVETIDVATMHSDLVAMRGRERPAEAVSRRTEVILRAQQLGEATLGDQALAICHSAVEHELHPACHVADTGVYSPGRSGDREIARGYDAELTGVLVKHVALGKILARLHGLRGPAGALHAERCENAPVYQCFVRLTFYTTCNLACSYEHLILIVETLAELRDGLGVGEHANQLFA